MNEPSTPFAMTLEIHPLCTLFPRLEGAEFEALKADITANGQLQPIVLHDGMILDGGNRYRACVELGIEPLIADIDLGDYDLLSYVLSVNLLRRHLTPGQHAAIVTAATNWIEAQTRGGDRRSEQSATLHFETTADRAAKSGASIRTQKMADKVGKSDPELVKDVALGKISLPQTLKLVEGKDQPVPEAGSESESSCVDAVEESSSAQVDDDVWAEMDGLRNQVSTLNRQIDSLSAMDRGEEINRLAQQVFHLENRVSDLSRKNGMQRQQLDWFGAKFNELRKLTGAKQDRDVVGLVRKLVEGAK